MNTLLRLPLLLWRLLCRLGTSLLPDREALREDLQMDDGTFW